MCKSYIPVRMAFFVSDRVLCASTGGIGLEARLYDSVARRVFAVRVRRDLLKLLRFVNSSRIAGCCIAKFDGQVCDSCASCFINRDCFAYTIILRFDLQAMPFCRYIWSIVFGLQHGVRMWCTFRLRCLRKAAI
jgi:hypothetical protein